MATESILQSLSFPTATDLSGAQYKAVTVDNTGNVVLATSAKNSDGILQNNPNAGQTCNVAISGRSKAIVGAAVANGALLEVSSGKLVTVAAGTVVAKALEAGAGDGSVISVLILKSNAVYA